VRNILTRYDNVSFSAKQNPICTACNPYTNRNMHPNACWAARAAEAAGILRGNDGFWQMHHWLFNRGGGFTDAEIIEALPQLGYNSREFLDVMQGEETLRRVKADIDEANGLGLIRTPMIFINGVELKGWMAHNALIKAVDRLAAVNLTARDASQDRPPTAFQKCIADWREEPTTKLPPDTRAWPMGPDRAAVRVVLWGDYQEPFTREADGILRRITASRGDTRYTFRHYPIDQTCNPTATRTLHELACLASRAAEAAGTIGGNDGYWAMHAWLFDNLERLSEQTLHEAADELGIDEGALFAELQAAQVTGAIEEDATAGQTVSLTSVPLIFINQKRVPRWRVEGVPAGLIEAAAQDPSPTSR
jgi:protein-disulfide isomerase